MKASISSHFLSLLMLLALALPASAGTRTVTYDRPHKTLSVATGISVKYNYTNTKSTRIVITAPDNVIDNVVAESRGNTIYIKVKSNNYNRRTTTSGNISVTVSGPLFSEFEAQSGSKIVCANRLVYSATTKVKVDASSASTVVIPGIECGKLDVETSSATTVKIISVKADRVEADASSASKCELRAIRADRLEVEASSSASVTVAGKVHSVDVEASSASSVNMASLTYENVQVDKSSAASVKR